MIFFWSFPFWQLLQILKKIAELLRNQALFFRVIGRLLPDAGAWSVTLDTQLRQFFYAIAATPAAIRTFADNVWGDIFPITTRQLDEWEALLILNTTAELDTAERRARLDAWWKAQGGQSPRYLRDIFLANGFDVWTHPWWDDTITYSHGVLPGSVNNPLLVLGGGPVYIAACGETPDDCGEASMLCGNTSNPAGRILVNKIPGVTYSVPVDSDEWPYILYIGGEVYPAHAIVLASRKEEFEDLVLRMCPGHLQLGMLITYV